MKWNGYTALFIYGTILFAIIIVLMFVIQWPHK